MFKLILLAGLAIGAAACATKTDPVAEVGDLPQNFQPQERITELSASLEKARRDNLDILAPQNFVAASRSLEDAKKIRKNRGSLEELATELQKSESYLKKANFYGSIARKNVPNLIDTRKRLLLERGDELSKFEKYDNEFTEIMKRIEDDELEGARKEATELRQKMDSLITEAIKAQAVGVSKAELANMSEDDKDLVPNTASRVVAMIEDLETYVERNRDKDEQIVKRSTELRNEVERMKVLVSEAKKSTELSPEARALRTERLLNQVSTGVAVPGMKSLKMEERSILIGSRVKALNQRLDYTTEDLRNAYSELGTKVQNLNSLKSEVARQERELQNQKEPEWKIQQVTKTLDSSGVNVVERKDDLVIQLTGLNFKTGSYQIPSSSYTMLGELGTLIGSYYPDYSITIEGHTDSTGSKDLNQKLAQRRALAVRDFLSAQNSDLKDNFQVSEANFESPVAANRSSKGRSLNRRVDVIIEKASALD